MHRVSQQLRKSSRVCADILSCWKRYPAITSENGWTGCPGRRNRHWQDDARKDSATAVKRRESYSEGTCLCSTKHKKSVSELNEAHDIDKVPGNLTLVTRGSRSTIQKRGWGKSALTVRKADQSIGGNRSANCFGNFARRVEGGIYKHLRQQI